MSKIPGLKGREVVRAFERAGFVVIRIKGSHHIMARPGHPNRLSVPVHKGRDLKLGTLLSQIAAAGLTVDEFIALL